MLETIQNALWQFVKTAAQVDLVLLLIWVGIVLAAGLRDYVRGR